MPYRPTTEKEEQMDLSPYLNFNGSCVEAFTFYQRQLGGELNIFTFGSSPATDSVPADWQDKAMHAHLQVGGKALMGSDAPPPHFLQPQGFSVSITSATAAESERLYNAFAEGGSVIMPFGATFWSPGFGMLVDRFGTPWMFNTDQPAS
jgi:PhnB protein